MARVTHSQLMHRGADGGPLDADDILIDDVAGDFTATTVEGALAELAAAGGGSGAPTDADYLVGTAHAGLSAEIVVGATPGGELGGTWASPTVDATHSGSAHHAAVTVGTGLDVTGQLVELSLDEVAAGGELGGFMDAPTVDATHSGSTHAAAQAAAEATAAAALGVHAGAADPHTGYLKEGDFDDVDFLVGTATGFTAAEIVVGASPGGELGGTWASPTVDATHSGSAHHDPVTVGTGLDVTGQLVELDLSEVASGGELGGFMDAPTVDASHSGSTHAATQAAAEATAAAALSAHLTDTSDAHDASAISIADAGNDFTATDVEGALDELQADNEAHVAAADPHTGYVREADANWIDLTDGGASTLHSHAGGGGGAPTTVDYLVGTADAGLSAEIVVGTTPGGELGGTWASPTVDATHSGSAHHAQSHNHSAAGDGTTLIPLLIQSTLGEWALSNDGSASFTDLEVLDDLEISDQLIMLGSSASADQIIIPDTVAGAGLTIGGDTNLYRAAANTLQTDDLFVVGTNVANGTGTVINTGSIELFVENSTPFIDFKNEQADDFDHRLWMVDNDVFQVSGNVLKQTTLQRFGGTSFPTAGKATGDMFYRTDLGMQFYWDGTRWLSTTLYSLPLTHHVSEAITAIANISATRAGYMRQFTPVLLGSDIWIIDFTTSFYIAGGTALSGSHKWDIALKSARDATNATLDTIATLNITSGTVSVVRRTTTAVGALLNNGTVHDWFQVDATKTGTPGNFQAWIEVRYRHVAT